MGPNPSAVVFSSYFVIDSTLLVFVITIQRYFLAHDEADTVVCLQFLIGESVHMKVKVKCGLDSISSGPFFSEDRFLNKAVPLYFHV